jgi:hypothetical protein
MYPEVLSIKNTHLLLRISRTQVYRLIEDGLLKEVNIDGKRMVDKESVFRYKGYIDQISLIKQQMKQVTQVT